MSTADEDWAAWSAELAETSTHLSTAPPTLPGLAAPLPPAPVPILSATPKRGICWACGSNTAPPRRPGRGPTYCRACWASGQAQPWINCTSCGAARKRTKPGQTSFTCTTCKEHTP